MGYRAKTWDGSQWIDLGSNGIDSSVYASKSYVNTAYPGRNLIHNGAMQIHQRGTSTASITTGNYYTVDRWNTGISSLGTWTQSVENDAPTGSGFRKSLKMLCTAADASPAAGDYAYISQIIEGQNLQNIKKGTASALPLTLSFWVKSNKTGTYAFELYDLDNTRLVGSTYTINVSATWEQKVITLPADTTGAFNNDNDGSLFLGFWLAAGSTYSSGTTQTQWGAAVSANRVPGQTNLADTNNNYFQITGVQLETGSTATPYEFKDYADDLRTCQRYYWTPAPVGGERALGMGVYFSAADVYVRFNAPVTMRATPVISGNTATDKFYTYVTGSVDSITLNGTADAYTNASVMGATFTGGGRSTGVAAILNQWSDGWLAFSADL